jgi:hypothetical protein
MKRWWIAVFVAGVSFTAPVFAHDYDDDRTAWSAGRAIRAGNSDRDHDRWDGSRDARRTHREEARRAEVRRYYAARAHAKHDKYHRARARAYAEDARESAARARSHAARAHRW